MALDARTDSSNISSRSLHWAPLRSWNLFSGRVRSRLPKEPPPPQLSHSHSSRNCGGEGSRTCPTTARGARPRASESTRKGGDCSRRCHNVRGREGGLRQGVVPVTDELSTSHAGAIPTAGSEVSGRRRALQDRAVEASDASALTRSNRPSATAAHHQHHHYHHQHHDHHHHHYHYHHVYHRGPRRQSEQDQSTRIPTTTSANTSSSHRPARRSSDQHGALGGRMPSVTTTTNSHVAISTRNAAIEARDRLAERLRGAALLSHRHSNAGLPGGFLEEFSLLFDDEDDAWSDEDMWELGVQDWLAAWGYGDGWQADMLASAELLAAPKGVSKSVIRNLHKEVFVPKLRRKDKEVGDASPEQEDCSVCLEHFLAGQLLINLPCKHRFHPDCLTPWLESHGQCPYCRARIVDEGRGEASSSGGGTVMGPSSDDELVAWMGLTIN